MTGSAPPQPALRGGRRYYFAYGSNMGQQQIRRRCPSKCLVGIARLRGYRWQINERGVANVVPTTITVATSPAPATTADPADGRREGEQSGEEEVVEGLLYTLGDPADEAALDEHDGVAAGCYEKLVLDVEVVAELAAACGPAIRALVYLSRTHTTDGPIHVQYAPRLEKAAREARWLGVSADYLNRRLLPAITGLIWETDDD